MSSGIRTALTLGALGLVVVVAAVVGWNAMTAPFPEREKPPTCVSKRLVAGDTLFRDSVVVSVFNASSRTGLASSTMDKLTGVGFVAGSTGNATERSNRTKIYSSNSLDPAVQLVAQQFRGAKIVPGEPLGEGVVVVVGQKFQDLRKDGPESIVVENDTTICAAPGGE